MRDVMTVNCMRQAFSGGSVAERSRSLLVPPPEILQHVPSVANLSYENTHKATFSVTTMMQTHANVRRLPRSAEEVRPDLRWDGGAGPVNTSSQQPST